MTKFRTCTTPLQASTLSTRLRTRNPTAANVAPPAITMGTATTLPAGGRYEKATTAVAAISPSYTKPVSSLTPTPAARIVHGGAAVNRS
jgi:hypothetical protein